MAEGSQLLTSKAAIRRLAQDKGPFAIAKLYALMECGKEAVELGAAQALLDRGFGKPEQDHTVLGDPNNPILHTHAFNPAAIQAVDGLVSAIAGARARQGDAETDTNGPVLLDPVCDDAQGCGAPVVA